MDIPVIILTNLPKEASAKKAKSLGAIDYFVKAECEPEKLAEMTKKILVFSIILIYINQSRD